MKVVTVLGTRPEIIRLSRVMARFDSIFDHVVVHTGQNYDDELNSIFFEQLGIREPDHFLDVDTRSLGRCMGEVLIKTEAVLQAEEPDAVLVLGDTNSAIALLMARRMKIPTYHMEAGNRSFDGNVPEELNRRMIDHIADFNLVYTEHARRHLISEGIHQRFIYLTGSPMREILDHYEDSIAGSDILKSLSLDKGNYFVVSLHREENVDDPESLAQLMQRLGELRSEYDLPVIVSTHPRTRSRLAAIGQEIDADGLRFLKPFGYFDYVKLQANARCVISDSGTISEESAILGFPAVTLRRSMERPEALDCGAIGITGFDADAFRLGVRMAIDDGVQSARSNGSIPPEYQVRDTSRRVARLVAGTARLCHRWNNVDSFSRYDWD